MSLPYRSTLHLLTCQHLATCHLVPGLNRPPPVPMTPLLPRQKAPLKHPDVPYLPLVSFDTPLVTCQHPCCLVTWCRHWTAHPVPMTPLLISPPHPLPRHHFDQTKHTENDCPFGCHSHPKSRYTCINTQMHNYIHVIIYFLAICFMWSTPYSPECSLVDDGVDVSQLLVNGMVIWTWEMGYSDPSTPRYWKHARWLDNIYECKLLKPCSTKYLVFCVGHS